MAGGVQQQAVSIHAPAWGATPAGGAQAGQEPVSIHAPAWGATRQHGAFLCPFPVSIHAPAWGATSAHSLYSHRPEAFQSTHPRGVRHGKSLTVSGTTLCFNPRTRVGCDAWRIRTASTKLCFNPRTRVGCDAANSIKGLDEALFQSTHPRGVRRGTPCALRFPICVSIHAPAWGATGPTDGPLGGRDGFNPRTRVGCDSHQRWWLCSCDVVSIHAPAWGATVLRIKQRLMLARFNPRTRVGCDSQKQANEDSIHGFNPRTRVGCDFSNPQ